jgi:integrative and conjugative element protein (TIGR02256 family)
MCDLCQQSGGKETGGLLVGLYNEACDCAVISQIMPPPRDSRFGNTWFERGISGIRSNLIRFRKEESSYYLGEWHYHPNSNARPSPQDRFQMKSTDLRSAFICPEPILLIIGGSARIGWSTSVWVFPESQTEIELFARHEVIL